MRFLPLNTGLLLLTIVSPIVPAVWAQETVAGAGNNTSAAPPASASTPGTVNGWVRLDNPATASTTPGARAAETQPLPVMPMAGDPAAQAADPACRVRKTVEAGVAMGGVSGKYVGAELAYGRDDRALAAGYPPNPCPTTGFGMSVSVSQSDMEYKSRRRYRGDSYDSGRGGAVLDPYGRPMGEVDPMFPSPPEHLGGG
ncbi:hypothetical protein [Niveispirillum irakense]|uniref:hypothetical protein n=1 Tax=Niveispirillum irakense TaxID=34011 RepID=UPI000419A44F|nr:hypothetical protein [Niveispirillum irakense]